MTLNTLCFLLIFVASPTASGQQETLRVVTLNVWSGLDYRGVFSVGEYESTEARERRRMLLTEGLRALNPDIVFLQEVNPVVGASRGLARALGMEEIHQVSNAGIKICSLGFPANFTEGMTILARPSFGLEEVRAYKLSGSVGIYGDALTVHFDETIVTLVGRITVAGRPAFLVNVHLSAAPPLNDSLETRFRRLERDRGEDTAAIESAIDEWQKGVRRRSLEIERLTAVLHSLPADVPVIVGGDFNAEVADSQLQPFLHAANLQPVIPPGSSGEQASWDPAANEKISLSTRLTDAAGDSLDPFGVLMALDSQDKRCIDHIFLSRQWNAGDVLEARRVFVDSSPEGHVSDHFGVFARIAATAAISGAPREWDSVMPLAESTVEPFPILSYDTDVGLGVGGKVFVLNALGVRESFDLVLFGSTKGERWARFVFSVPDFELRQGKVYPLALDLAVDFDRWIAYNFFGVGNKSRYEDRERYTRTPLDVSLTANFGFSRYFVGQVGVRYLTVQNADFVSGSALEHLPPAQNAGRATANSVFLSARTDTRDSYINPSRGLVTKFDLEVAPKIGLGNTGYSRLGAWVQGYCCPFLTRVVLAGRLGFQGLMGTDIPVQMLLPIGGNWTVRGLVQDRYLDRISAVANIEIRFPVFWRLGGLLGYDAGKVWHNPGELDLRCWASNPVVGLRFYMDTYVVRLDVGFGRETTGLYLNFGHVF